MNHGGTAEAPITLQADPIGSAIVAGADPIGGFTEATTPSNMQDEANIWMTSSYKSPYIPMDNAFNLRENWLKQGQEGAQQVELRCGGVSHAAAPSSSLQHGHLII